MKPRIKFYCRSFNKELYYLSLALYRTSGYPCIRLTDKSADGYFFAILKDTDCDIAINIDEDCFISDLDSVIKLALRTWEKGWVNVGCSDAGKGIPRSGAAEITNPFFNVFNIYKIRSKWSPSIIPALKKDCLTTIEPYYNFFHWMMNEFPGDTIYLQSDSHQDGLSTILYDDDGHHLCSHTWFARQFKPSILSHIFEGNDVKGINHSKRIRLLIAEIYRERGLAVPTFSAMDRIGFAFDEMARWSIKVPQRIYRLPLKLSNKWKYRK